MKRPACTPDPTNINDVLDGHTSLDLACVDRLYLNAYVPGLQLGGQVATFLTRHLGNPVASPALFQVIGNRFRKAVAAFAEQNAIPILHLNRPDRSKWDDRKIDHVQTYLDRAQTEGRYGVVVIVAAQEVQRVFMGRQNGKGTHGKAVNFSFEKTDRAVTVYYFYVLDPQFGAGFIKLCTYFPYPGKVWLNGHEWAKRQAEAAGLAYSQLANGFSACDEPAHLQAICDQFGSIHVQAFFDRWITQIPVPLTPRDQRCGYWWELSMRQVEVSRTMVFDQPRHARAFFEALVADNVGIGRPEQMSMVFARQVRKTTKEPFRTRVFGQGTDVRIDFTYKHSRIKQYLKEGPCASKL